MSYEIHPEIQAIIDTPSDQRLEKMGFFSFTPVPENSEDGLPQFELYFFGSGVLFSDLIDIIDEMKRYIDKQERDHAETISDLLQEFG